MNENLYDQVEDYARGDVDSKDEIAEEIASARTARHSHIDETFVDRNQIVLHQDKLQHGNVDSKLAAA